MAVFEDSQIDYKSLKKVTGNTADFSSLAETCVAFANAQGGELVIGIEDKEAAPDKNQKISTDVMNKTVARLRDLTDAVGFVNPEIVTHKNGGQYFKFSIFPTTRTIATTSNGKVFVRVTDNSVPIAGEELTNLAAEKNAFQWELVSVGKITLDQADINEVTYFVEQIQESKLVSDFIKQKTTEEILEHYQLINQDGYLTNLGTIWLGKASQRARLSYPITVQYIVYNDLEEKIRKKDWHFHLHNPKKLLLEIEKEAVELNYSTEISSGLFRKQLRNYPTEVIRELLINAIAHKRYTLSGDIFIEVYPDRMVISNPGGLPLGITANNILHERQRRNPHLILTLQDLGLMEGEGSGYDLIYEKLAREIKPLPIIESNFNKTTVTIYSGVVNKEALEILDYVAQHFKLSQKEFTVLGIIASEKKILSTQLSQKLQLNTEDRLSSWIGSLLEKNILMSRGIKKGTEYLLNPALFAQSKLNITPSLKTIDKEQLKHLIMEYLKYNGERSKQEIHQHIQDVEIDDVQKCLYSLVELKKLTTTGARRNRKYLLHKKNK
ncbi:ATP-binding protein [Zobellia galactanivorans]|uniref:Possible transcriptional regulator n=1 Tax=Zobellia galactanivorans (strain DSM 12802 / CCUG 47099 / CIP 106680 / NCIMB 13871 / Dsij) TaxID=63186 RepID=G0L4H5_ZOBGA|nr:ATP-binding protein [Zobellia galactanivorans]CAZ95711.1 Possible transcriptional regulator [Zobellia galactanivorans]